MATTGFGAKIQVQTNGSTWVDIADGVTLGLPKPEVGEAEYTHLAQADRYRRYLPTLIEAGVVPFECDYAKATVLQLDPLLGVAKVTTNDVKWKITGPDEDGAGAVTAVTFTFNGFLQKLDYGDPEKDEILIIKGEVRIDGPITIA